MMDMSYSLIVDNARWSSVVWVQWSELPVAETFGDYISKFSQFGDYISKFGQISK